MTDLGGEFDSLLIMAIQEMVKGRSQKVAHTLETIIKTNQKRGRIEWYLKQNPEHTVQAYVRNVGQQYDAQHEHIEALQIHRHEATWAELSVKLQTQAYFIFMKWGLGPQQSRLMAADAAQDACESFLFAHYPYDGSFGTWMTRLLYHACRKYIKMRHHEQKLQQKIEVDTEAEHVDNSLSPTHQDAVEWDITRKDILNGIQQLSPKQQDALLCHYFGGLSWEEIASISGVSPNTIYKRHHDAIYRVRKILGANEH